MLILILNSHRSADVYLAGTVMLIFGMGLYGLFISNVPVDSHPSEDRALKGSSLFGMFALKVICLFLLLNFISDCTMVYMLLYPLVILAMSRKL